MFSSSPMVLSLLETNAKKKYYFAIIDIGNRYIVPLKDSERKCEVVLFFLVKINIIDQTK